uniref:probable potassium transporter 17 isoform X3 n=1 Tax=Erigeron canadensis TaxID=72917 RepID=UPI001CB9BA0E|nr:probable potassium transporter 17 isoform X3 [Erigeron canadensis]
MFGGLVTSPLYVYPSMALKSPTEEAYLGIYCIMFWTLSLIGVVKYACIALKADDQGEGGTYALYSLLCRHMNIGAITSTGVSSPSRRSHDNSLHQSFKKSSRLGMFIERSLIASRILFFIAILGMCMLIGDGILTHAISVLSAMEGIRVRFPKFSKSLVEALSAAVLIVLFLLQKYGTARFFSRNGHEGWLLLNDMFLCIIDIPGEFVKALNEGIFMKTSTKTLMPAMRNS